MSSKPRFTAATGRFRASEEHFQRESNRFKYDPKKLSWIQRNPRLFVKISTTVALLVFFSKPIYDLTIGYYLYDPANPPPKKNVSFYTYASKKVPIVDGVTAPVKEER
jgi:hypothetical protein